MKSQRESENKLNFSGVIELDEVGEKGETEMSPVKMQSDKILERVSINAEKEISLRDR